VGSGVAVSSAALYAWDAAVADYCSFMAARGSNEMSLRPRRSHLGALARGVDCGPWEVTQAQLFRFRPRRLEAGDPEVSTDRADDSTYRR